MRRRRKWGLAIAATGLVAAVTLYSMQGWLARRAFERALDQTVGVDGSLALGDGLHAYVCGSGSPFPDPQRAGPCIAVMAGREGFIFDSGSGSARKLLRMGFPAERLRGIYLTHLHSDHIDGLGETLLQAWVGGSRAAPLPVAGPTGTARVVAGLVQAYAIDRDFRIAHHGALVARPAGFGALASEIVIPPTSASLVAYDSGGVKITAIRVNHAPVAPAFGYRIDYKSRSIAISGDTVFSPDFVAGSRGVDVMFHEALNPQMIEAMRAKLAQRGRVDAARIMGDIPSYHASPEDAARAAKHAGAKALVLYHLVPSVPPGLIEPLFVGDAGKQYGGPLKLARDGMIVSLPAGGGEAKFSHRF